MRPSHLWSLRKEIFGLGTLQIVTCALVLTSIAKLFGLPWQVAFIGATGFVLTSTAVVMQLLAERGDIALPSGQKIVSILLFEDLLIVPLLALVAWMGPSAGSADGEGSRWLSVAIGVGAIVGLVLVGRFLLNPLFRVLAESKAREVMTAAALLVVLGAALLMQLSGLSMAMGAFLAGVLLSESTFRHQIEADIEPFRGILLGLFFLSVGMALDLGVVAGNWQLILGLVLALMAAKALCIYVVARIMGSDHAQALDRGVLMAQGGELPCAVLCRRIGRRDQSGINANFTAVVVLSMALTPLVVLVYKRIAPKPTVNMDGVDEAEGLSGSVLLIGFGRFGQVASQSLLARDVDVTIIDNDVEMIQSAARFGFKIYYGDGTRLDVLHASGAATARAIAVCVDKAEAADRIVELVAHEFPQAKLMVRSFDREHSLRLIHAGVDSRSARRLNRQCCSVRPRWWSWVRMKTMRWRLPSRSAAATPSASNWRLPVVV
ncbi:potassium transporter [Stenotrophomonas maltophilia]|uniref:Potassium transporter n=1 Tax=Stenotrophomonas maltophilia TaxID=40324 RepID=A0A0F5ZQV8_STEMA|nr:potassium transporter [Stenotrophomonas maltophilia]